MLLMIGLATIIAFIIFTTAKLRWHPFLVLIVTAILTALIYRLPLADIPKIIGNGFGGILGYIGLVIVFGTIIGVILEKTGAAIVMAETVIRFIGTRFPILTMSIVGAIVSIPVFCDSGFVILHSLKQSLARRLHVSGIAMSVALATGLYATHTFVPPTPGPIAAAGNLGLENNLGLVIAIGLLVALIPVLAGCWWASWFKNEHEAGEALSEKTQAVLEQKEAAEQQRTAYGQLPTPLMAFLPIILPIMLIFLGSIANFPSKPIGDDNIIYNTMMFFGKPVIALFIGMLVAFTLMNKANDDVHVTQKINDAIAQGLIIAAPILLITGAGGAFGAVLKATPIGDYLKTTLSGFGLGLFMPFTVAAALKTAQGSSTVALVATSALVAPLLPELGLDSDIGRTLTVMAIGAGAMTISHANDSFFWVVSQFSRMSVGQAYRAQTLATLVQGVTGMIFTWILSLILL